MAHRIETNCRSAAAVLRCLQADINRPEWLDYTTLERNAATDGFVVLVVQFGIGGALMRDMLLQLDVGGLLD